MCICTTSWPIYEVWCSLLIVKLVKILEIRLEMSGIISQGARTLFGLNLSTKKNNNNNKRKKEKEDSKARLLFVHLNALLSLHSWVEMIRSLRIEENKGKLIGNSAAMFYQLPAFLYQEQQKKLKAHFITEHTVMNPTEEFLAILSLSLYSFESQRGECKNKRQQVIVLKRGKFSEERCLHGMLFHIYRPLPYT